MFGPCIAWKLSRDVVAASFRSGINRGRRPITPRGLVEYTGEKREKGGQHLPSRQGRGSKHGIARNTGYGLTDPSRRLCGLGIHPPVAEIVHNALRNTYKYLPIVCVSQIRQGDMSESGNAQVVLCTYNVIPCNMLHTTCMDVLRICMCGLVFWYVPIRKHRRHCHIIVLFITLARRWWRPFKHRRPQRAECIERVVTLVKGLREIIIATMSWEKQGRNG